MIVTHIIETPTDHHTLCGEKVNKQSGPRVLARFVGAHQRGYGLIVCSYCKAVAEREAIPLDVLVVVERNPNP